MKADNIKNETKPISLLSLILLFITLFVIFDLYPNDLELQVDGKCVHPHEHRQTM